jgi:type IV pilus assembly protein PilY1
MLNTRLIVRLAFAASVGLAVLSHAARAEDIDIYSLPSTEGLLPNVLFIIDNTANWGATITTPKCDVAAANVRTNEEGTKMGAEKCALYKLFNSMSLEDMAQFNFGFMLFNESPNSASYPRQAFVNVTTQARKDELLKFIADLHILNDKGNNAATAEAFYEAWLYFTSSAVRLGRGTPKFDPAAFNGDLYAGPSVYCTKNHIIYLANGSPGDNNNVALELLKKLNPSATRTAIPVSWKVSNPDEANWSDEFAAFFNRGVDLNSETEGAQNINVHAIAVTGASSDGNYPNYIRWIAAEGGGLYQEASNSQMVIDALTGVLNQIRSKNAVFSSASLPVSANTQGTFLNQVFIGMFRPDGNALQRWVGNLKQYQFLYDDQLDTLQLADANGVPAVSAGTGFIVSTATSFWTKPSSFWIKREASSNGDYSRSDAPDGELVEKGGIGQWLRTNYSTSFDRLNRPVYTCTGSCSSGSGVDLSGSIDYAFSTSNGKLNPGMFSVATDAEWKLLVDWARGEENIATSLGQDQLTAAPDGQNVRPMIHGDVLHSRPAAINYGGTRGIVVFYGANDGMFRAVNGNQAGTGAGSELWAFVAEEHFTKLKRLRENLPEVKYPSTSATLATARPRDYFFDGPIGFYQNTIAGQEEVILFPTMRRGGKSVYALDVTNPDKPKLLWRINPTESSYGQLGQTWSMPRVSIVKGHDKPVLIMGGGYDDVAEDASPAGTTSIGKGVYVIDMRSGSRLAWLPTDYSVPSDVALVDTDGDGKVDRGYVTDVRAQVYRIDMESADGTLRKPSDWVITKIAALNDGTGGIDGTRKAFFAPDVVLSRNFTSLLLGTGDREKPLDMKSNDRFYVIKDSKVSKGEPTGVSVITDAVLAEIGATDAGADPEGCAFSLNQAGERVINQPITFGGITYFSTNRPLPADSKSCSRAENKAYQVPLVCRAPKFQPLVGDGLPPSPVVGYVDVSKDPNVQKLVPFVIGGANPKQSAIEVNRANIPIPPNRRRSYWYMENRDR